MADKKPVFKNEKANSILKFSGMAFQFFALMVIAAFLGTKLDAYFGLEKPLITIFLILFFTAGYFVKLYRELFS